MMFGFNLVAMAKVNWVLLLSLSKKFDQVLLVNY